jgi:hypothetical protein
MSGGTDMWAVTARPVRAYPATDPDETPKKDAPPAQMKVVGIPFAISEFV